MCVGVGYAYVYAGGIDMSSLGHATCGRWPFCCHCCSSLGEHVVSIDYLRGVGWHVAHQSLKPDAV